MKSERFFFDLGWFFVIILNSISFFAALWSRDWLVFPVTGIIFLLLTMMANQVRLDELKSMFDMQINELKSREFIYEKESIHKRSEQAQGCADES